MIYFWILYLLLSLIISFSFYKICNSSVLKILTFSTFFGLSNGVWFVLPGSDTLAPAISILILENTVIESNGYIRLLRPMLVSFIVGLSISIAFHLTKGLVFLRRKKPKVLSSKLFSFIRRNFF